MTFTDLAGLAYHNEPVYYYPEEVMPYCNRNLGANLHTPSWSPDWDLWSVGMMSLEVIVGSELVLPLKTYQDVEYLMADIQGHIPMATHRLLHEMLFQVRAENVVQNAKGEYFETIYSIT